MSKSSIKRGLLGVVALLTYFSSAAQMVSKPNLESKGIEDIMVFQLFEPEPVKRPELPKAILANVSADYGVTNHFSADNGVDDFSYPSWGAKLGVWTSSYAGFELGYSSFDDSFAQKLHGNEEWNAMKQQLTDHNFELSYLFHLTNFANEDFSIDRFYFVGVVGADFGIGSQVAGVGVHGALRALYNIKNTPVTFYFEPRVGYNYVAERYGDNTRKLSSNARFSFGMEFSLTGEKGKPNLARFTAESAKTLSRLLYDFSLSTGAEAVISENNTVRSASVFTRLAAGVTLSPVSGFEIGYSYYDWGINNSLHSYDLWSDTVGASLPDMGIDASYRLDLINAITGRSRYKLFGVDLLAGGNIRWGGAGVSAYGGQVSSRLSYNFNQSVSIFAEPKLTILASSNIEELNPDRSVHFLPSVSVGARFNINRHYDAIEIAKAKESKLDQLSKIPVTYFLGALSVETMLRTELGPIGALTLGARGGMGIYLSDVSALEGKVEFFKFPFTTELHSNPTWNSDYYSKLPDVGATLSYRYNITNAIRKSTHRDGMSLGEISALVGITARDGGGAMVLGSQISARAALNVSRTVSLFAEPKMTMFYADRFSDINGGGSVTFVPSVDVGMELYLNRHTFKSAGYGDMLPIYFLASSGFESISSSDYGFTEATSFIAGIGLGTYVSEVSAFEARFDLYKFPLSERMHASENWAGQFYNSAVAGLSLGYRYNITNALRRGLETLPRFEVSALVSGEARVAISDLTVGGNLSLRGSVNATRTLAFYVEPKYSIQGFSGDMTLTGGTKSQNIPSLSFGMEVYLAGRSRTPSRIDRITEGSTLYMIGYGGVEMISNYDLSLINSMNLMMGGGFGTYVSNTSAIEAHVEWYKIPWSIDCHADPSWESRYYNALPYGAASLLYRFNLTNAINGESSILPVGEVSLLGGAQCRVGRAEATIGYQFSVRGSVNLSKTVSLFLEPKYSVHYGESNKALTGSSKMVMPSVNAGMEIYLNRKKSQE